MGIVVLEREMLETEGEDVLYAGIDAEGGRPTHVAGSGTKQVQLSH